MKRIQYRCSLAGALILMALGMFTQPADAGQKTLPHIELRIFGAVTTLPDYTASANFFPDDPVNPGFFDQCRERGAETQSVSQRRTMLDLSALGLGTQLRSISIQFGKTARVGSPVTLTSFLNSRCYLAAQGVITAGSWPLQPGTPGPILQVRILNGGWTVNRVGGGTCPAITQPGGDVFIEVRSDERRNGAECNCPFDYTDTDLNGVADECED